jgi:hypothetical protein
MITNTNFRYKEASWKVNPYIIGLANGICIVIKKKKSDLYILLKNTIQKNIGGELTIQGSFEGFQHCR